MDLTCESWTDPQTGITHKMSVVLATPTWQRRGLIATISCSHGGLQKSCTHIHRTRAAARACAEAGIAGWSNVATSLCACAVAGKGSRTA